MELTTFLTICSVLIAALGLVKRKFLAVILFVIFIGVLMFFKPIVLWGATGEFARIFRDQVRLSVVATIVVAYTMYFKGEMSNPSQQTLLAYTVSPLIAGIVSKISSGKLLAELQLEHVVPTYISLLSSTHKIDAASWVVIFQQYEVSLYFALIMVQLLIYVVFLVRAIWLWLSQFGSAPTYLLYAQSSSRALFPPIVLFALPTNFLYLITVRALSFYF